MVSNITNQSIDISSDEIFKVNVTSPLESNGAIPVNIQDQTSPAFDIFFMQVDNDTQTTLAQNYFIDDQLINLTNATGYTPGQLLNIFEGSNYYYGEIISVNGNEIELDTPLDFNYTTSALVAESSRDISVDGSLETQIYEIALPGSAEISIDITRIMFAMICVDPPEYNEFCDIPGGLTYGIVLRRKDGIYQNYWNVKSNGELANLMFDLNYYEQTWPQGVNGIAGRLTYGGQSKHGVTIRLDPGDSLQLLVQDDLTSLVEFRIIAEGHVVTD
jgi:hypothetical protein